MIPEPTQYGNPYQLAIRQHVFPRASIARFAGTDGKVSVKRVGEGTARKYSPGSKIFCAKRAWDQRSEIGYMKDIEDEFQNLAKEIDCGLDCLTPLQHLAATRFFALWSLRAQIEYSPIPDQPVRGGIRGEPWTKDQQERLEKQGAIYIRSDQTMPGRFAAGWQVLMGIDAVTAQFDGRAWRIVKADEGEFVCPDSFGQLAALPVTPTVSLHLGHQDSTISKREVAMWNCLARQLARRYIFARDFAACPL